MGADAQGAENLAGERVPAVAVVRNQGRQRPVGEPGLDPRGIGEQGAEFVAEIGVVEVTGQGPAQIGVGDRTGPPSGIAAPVALKQLSVSGGEPRSAEPQGQHVIMQAVSGVPAFVGVDEQVTVGEPRQQIVDPASGSSGCHSSQAASRGNAPRRQTRPAARNVPWSASGRPAMAASITSNSDRYLSTSRSVPVWTESFLIGPARQRRIRSGRPWPRRWPPRAPGRQPGRTAPERRPAVFPEPGSSSGPAAPAPGRGQLVDPDLLGLDRPGQLGQAGIEHDGALGR